MEIDLNLFLVHYWNVGKFCNIKVCFKRILYSCDRIQACYFPPGSTVLAPSVFSILHLSVNPYFETWQHYCQILLSCKDAISSDVKHTSFKIWRKNSAVRLPFDGVKSYFRERALTAPIMSFDANLKASILFEKCNPRE